MFPARTTLRGTERIRPVRARASGRCYESSNPAMYRLLFADDQGVVYDHPHLRAGARTGGDVIRPTGRPLPLPTGGGLCILPGRRPVGFDPETGRPAVLREVRVGRRTFVPVAVGATLPPGYTRTLLPAAARPPLGTVGATRPPAVGLHRRRAGAGRARRLGAPHRPAAPLGPGAPLHPGASWPRRGAAGPCRQPGLPAARPLRAAVVLLHRPEHLLRPGRGGHPVLGHLQRPLRRMPLRVGRRDAAVESRPDPPCADRRGDGRGRGGSPRGRHGPDHGELRTGVRGRAPAPLEGDRPGHPARRGRAPAAAPST